MAETEGQLLELEPFGSCIAHRLELRNYCELLDNGVLVTTVGCPSGCELWWYETYPELEA